MVNTVVAHNCRIARPRLCLPLFARHPRVKSALVVPLEPCPAPLPVAPSTTCYRPRAPRAARPDPPALLLLSHTTEPTPSIFPFFSTLVQGSCRRCVDPLSLALPLIYARSSTSKAPDASSSSAALVLPTTTAGVPLKPPVRAEISSSPSLPPCPPPHI
jgi:hypothetical protein